MATGLLHGHQYLLLGMLVLQLPFISGRKYLLPAKKLISNTAVVTQISRTNLMVVFTADYVYSTEFLYGIWENTSVKY